MSEVPAPEGKGEFTPEQQSWLKSLEEELRQKSAEIVAERKLPETFQEAREDVRRVMNLDREVADILGTEGTDMLVDLAAQYRMETNSIQRQELLDNMHLAIKEKEEEARRAEKDEDYEKFEKLDHQLIMLNELIRIIEGGKL